MLLGDVMCASTLRKTADVRISRHCLKNLQIARDNITVRDHGNADKHIDYGTVATENRLSKCSGMPLGLCGQRLPELNLVPIQVIDPGKATVGFIHSFGVNLDSLLF